MRYLQIKDYSRVTSADASVFMKNEDLLKLPSSWTLEFFVHFNILAPNSKALNLMHCQLYLTDTSTETGNYISIFMAAKNILTLRIGSSITTTIALNDINKKWNHIAIVYNNNDSLIIYLNGENKLSAKVSSLNFKNYYKFDRFKFTLHKGDINICYTGIKVYRYIKYDSENFNIEFPEEIAYGYNSINEPIIEEPIIETNIEVNDNLDWSEEELENGYTTENIIVYKSSGVDIYTSPSYALTIIDNYKLMFDTDDVMNNIFNQITSMWMISFMFGLNFSDYIDDDYSRDTLKINIPSYYKDMNKFYYGIMMDKLYGICKVDNAFSFHVQHYNSQGYINLNKKVYINALCIGVASLEDAEAEANDKLIRLDFKSRLNMNKDIELYNHSYDFLQKAKILQDFTLCLNFDLDDTFEQEGLTIELLYQHNSEGKYPLIYAYDCIYNDETDKYIYPSPDIKNPITQTSRDMTNGCNITDITITQKLDNVEYTYKKNFIIYSSGITGKFTNYVFSIKPKNMYSTIKGGIKEKVNGLDNCDNTNLIDSSITNSKDSINYDKTIKYPWTNFETSDKDIGIKMSSSKRIRIYLYLKKDDYIILYKAQRSYLEVNSFDVEQMNYLYTHHVKRKSYINNKNKQILSLSLSHDTDHAISSHPDYVNMFEIDRSTHYYFPSSQIDYVITENLFVKEHIDKFYKPLFYYITTDENTALSYPVKLTNIKSKDDDSKPYFTAHSKGVLNDTHNYFIISRDYDDKETYKLQFNDTYNKTGYPSKYSTINPIEAISNDETKGARNVLEFINPCPSNLNDKSWVFECWVYFKVNNDKDDNYYNLLQIGTFPNINNIMGYISLIVQPSTGKLNIIVYKYDQICSKLFHVSIENSIKKEISQGLNVYGLNDNYKLIPNSWNHIAFYSVFNSHKFDTSSFSKSLVSDQDTDEAIKRSSYNINYFTSSIYLDNSGECKNTFVFSLNNDKVNYYSDFLVYDINTNKISNESFYAYMTYIHNILFFMHNDASPFKLLLTGVKFKYDKLSNIIRNFNVTKIQ